MTLLLFKFAQKVWNMSYGSFSHKDVGMDLGIMFHWFQTEDSIWMKPLSEIFFSIIRSWELSLAIEEDKTSARSEENVLGNSQQFKD